MKAGVLNLSTEKRCAPRMPVDWGLQVRLTGENEPILARAVNVSKGGLAVNLERLLPADGVAKVVLQPGDGQPELHAYAYVAWASVTADHPAAGLRFMGIDEQDEERLAGMVEAWVLSGGKGRHRN
jgi:hypothetical protein